MAFTSSKWTLRDEKCSDGNANGSGKLEEPKPGEQEQRHNNKHQRNIIHELLAKSAGSNTIN